jgi:hypothetical protein
VIYKEKGVADFGVMDSEVFSGPGEKITSKVETTINFFFK